jgi:hypothetical protein
MPDHSADGSVVLSAQGLPFTVAGVGDLLALFRCVSVRYRFSTDVTKPALMGAIGRVWSSKEVRTCMPPTLGAMLVPCRVSWWLGAAANPMPATLHIISSHMHISNRPGALHSHMQRMSHAASASGLKPAMPHCPAQPEMSLDVQHYDKQVYLRVSEARRCQVQSMLVVPIFGHDASGGTVAVFELIQNHCDGGFPAIMAQLQRCLEVRGPLLCPVIAAATHSRRNTLIYRSPVPVDVRCT